METWGNWGELKQTSAREREPRPHQDEIKETVTMCLHSTEVEIDVKKGS